jgi:16S rRNA (cytosine967-C5)-methyltransferase
VTALLESLQGIAPQLLSTALLVLAYVALRGIAVRRLRRDPGTEGADDARRILANVKSGLVVLLLLGLFLIWAPEIRTFALSLTAFTIAIIIATKELILCVSGTLLRTVSGAFGVGDWIEVGGIRGEVLERTLLSTTLQELHGDGPVHEFTGRTVVVPNSQFLTTPIRNERFYRRYVIHSFPIVLERTADPRPVETAVAAAIAENMAPHAEVAHRYNALIERRASREWTRRGGRMTPGGRISAAIEILEGLNAPPDGQGAPPADKAMADWARGNRFAGSKDRQAIAGMVYGVLRRRGQIDWWLDRVRAGAPGAEPTARDRLLIWLLLGEGWRLTDLEAAFDGERFSPEPLSQREKRVAIELGTQRGFEFGCQPVEAKANAPEWLAQRFQAVYGAEAARQAAAYLEEAPVDLRVNSLKADRPAAKAALAAEGIEAAETPLSPLGLRLKSRAPLSGTEAFKQGLIEPQDEGSQLAALLVDARPGQRVVDFCAGALQALGRALEARFDRVLVDAPCTGTGTWRRNPDQKWRTAERDLFRLMETQGAILESAARLVVPGGRLVYVTCSWLREENEAQIERLLNERPDFFAYPIRDVWDETVGALGGGDCPAADGATNLRLTPLEQGVDGFFVAVLGRKLA